MKHPIQPLALDAYGVMRFKPNAIVTYLLDTHPTCDLNTLARLNFSNEDRMQLAQLIGYSLSGFSELSYVDDYTFETAVNMANNINENAARIKYLEMRIEEMNKALAKLKEPPATLFNVDEENFKRLCKLFQP